MKKTPDDSRKRSKKKTTDSPRPSGKKSSTAPDPSLAGDPAADFPAENPFFIVALGASAGGLESFEKFFTNIPPDSGMAFVVIVHLDPHHKTMLPELLARYTRMEVLSAEEGMAVEPNTVYIIPANRDMTLVEGHLHLDEQAQPRGIRHTIDYFLRSLAEDAAEYAVAVILSGTGTDGTQGIKAVKLAGGLVVVEDERTARYGGMPQSATASGVADLVLPAEQIPKKLIELTRHPILAQRKTGQTERDIAGNLSLIFRLVRAHTGHDFSSYKINTMVRRIDRRMVVNDIRQVEDYVALLRENPDESKALFREVLIGVTSFFRDPEAFVALEQQIVPRLFKDRDPNESVRVWLAGCATGEEAYSVAILMREYLREQRLDNKVQIFATDLDQEAIGFARAGVYPEGIAADLSEERLKVFFKKSDDRYEVAKPLREMVVFAQHNLIKDPPFSHLDLLICRNLLIYLNPEVQKRLLPMFHQALQKGGFLFLGTSETVGIYTDIYDAVSKKWKIFEAREGRRRPGIEFPFATPTGNFIAEKKDRMGEKDGAIRPGQIAERILIQRYSPPCVVINENHEVLYYSTRTAQFLEPPIGEPTQDILRMAREDLRPALRAAIHKALATQEPAAYRELRVKVDAREELVNLLVEPLSHPAAVKGLALVIFETGNQKKLPVLKPVSSPRPAAEDDKDRIIAQLEEQLRITHEELQATIERLENSNEELKSSNEELMSINEEFQSTNEELETSKEELQALNEELVTVNAELESKIEELGQTNSDMQNLLNSSDIATIFLDRQLRVKRFTPRMADLFNLIESDRGRPLQHLSGKVFYPDLARDAKEILKSLTPIEREISTTDQHHYLMRMFPYRTTEDAIEGVVVTFIDITERKKAEEYRAQLAAIVEASTDAVIGKTLDGTITSWNPGAERIYGYTAKEMIGTKIDRIVPPEHQKEMSKVFSGLKQGKRINKLETERISKDNRRLQVSLSISPIHNEKGQAIAAATIARDITREKQQKVALEKSEKQQRARAEELAALMEAVPAAVWIATDPNCKSIKGNLASYDLFRLPRNANLSKSAPQGEAPTNFRVLHEGRELAPDELSVQRAAKTGDPVSDFEEEILFDDGSRVTIMGNASPLLDEENRPRGAVAAFIDITRLKETEEQLRQANQAKSEFLANVSHEVRTPLTGVMGNLTLLEGSDLNEEQRHLLLKAQNSSKSLLRIIEDILDFARLEAGRLSFEEEPFLLRQWFEDVIDRFVQMADESGIKISWSVSSDLPELIVSDRERLGQVLSNLLENAIKFTDKDGRVEITLDPARTQPNQPNQILVKMAVRDTGIGIPAEELDRIFQSFSQVDSSLHRKYGGTGLGLAISKKIVDRLDGDLTVESTVGKGSVFVCTVPLGRAEKISSQPSPKPPRVPPTLPSGKPLSVLLVEDDPTIGELMMTIFQHHKWQGTIASNGREALESWEKNQFDVILMDVQMPGLDGLEVTRMIREREKSKTRRTPIIALTAHAREENHRQCLEAGMDDVLTKPVTLEKLFGVVKKVTSV